ncbi:MAG: DUF1854 domain-containing protein [Planctomycetaceae bacterium]|nr:DUF1854 domain-containing protein [Planctomycetaceae bacterium]
MSGVHAVRAFPTLYDHQYISLRYRQTSGRVQEIGIIDELHRWPPTVREAIEQTLRRQYLLRRVREIRQIRTRENALTMLAITDGGSATIRLDKPGEGAQPFASNGLLLIDSGGHYFVISNRDTLPRRQQRLLSLYFGD